MYKLPSGAVEASITAMQKVEASAKRQDGLHVRRSYNSAIDALEDAKKQRALRPPARARLGNRPPASNFIFFKCRRQIPCDDGAATVPCALGLHQAHTETASGNSIWLAVMAARSSLKSQPWSEITQCAGLVNLGNRVR